MADNIVLVAPRPLRVDSFSQRPPFYPVTRMLSPPIDALTRVKLADNEGQPVDTNDEPPSSGRNTASPRLNLSSDALEEFLSILRPTLFKPSSPTFRTRRHEPGSALTVPIERSQAFRTRDGSHSKSPSLSSMNLDDKNATTAGSAPSPASDARQGGDNDHLLGSLWRIPGILESPVSRTHTRNPFQRHASYDSAFSGVFTTRMSPSLLPLPPSPSPAPPNLSPPALSADTEDNDI